MNKTPILSDRKITLDRIKLFAVILLALLGMILVIQNTDPVETRLLFWTITMPRAVLLFGATAIGFALGVLVSFLKAKQRRKADTAATVDTVDTVENTEAGRDNWRV